MKLMLREDNYLKHYYIINEWCLNLRTDHPSALTGRRCSGTLCRSPGAVWCAPPGAIAENYLRRSSCRCRSLPADPKGPARSPCGRRTWRRSWRNNCGGTSSGYPGRRSTTRQPPRRPADADGPPAGAWVRPIAGIRWVARRRADQLAGRRIGRQWAICGAAGQCDAWVERHTAAPIRHSTSERP